MSAAVDPLTGINPTAILSPAEVGAIVGKSAWTIRRMLDRGELAFRQIGSHRRITGAVLIAFLTGAHTPGRERLLSGATSSLGSRP